jgi:hypothetical protein
MRRIHTVLFIATPARRPVLIGQGKRNAPRATGKRFLKNNFRALWLRFFARHHYIRRAQPKTFMPKPRWKFQSVRPLLCAVFLAVAAASRAAEAPGSPFIVVSWNN